MKRTMRDVHEQTSVENAREGFSAALSVRMLIMAMQMIGIPNVDAGQNGKYIGLNERDTDFQSIYRNRKGKGQPSNQQSAADRHAEQDSENHVTSRHIRK